jgi:hypothetical protein
MGVCLSANVTLVPPLFEEDRKLVPVTVIVTDAFAQLVPQAGAEFGDTSVIVGTGFGVP